jgi:ComF family protein
VLSLKFRSGRYLVPLMGEFLRRELELRPLHADVVVPVPLAPRRMRQRGYNQALLLAHQVATIVRGEVIVDALVREERPPQQSLAAAERRLNVRGAFRCPRPTQVHNHTVVLIDDVVTTGATLSACTDTLAQAGARRVSALAFARDL